MRDIMVSSRLPHLLMRSVRAFIFGLAAGLASIFLLASETVSGQDTTAPTRDNTAALQQLLDAGSRVRIPAGEYFVSAPLLIDSNTLLEGDGNATVIHGRFDGPVIASRGYFSDRPEHAPRGYTRIRDLRIVGSMNPRHSKNHGILLRDFYSQVRDVTIDDVGGSGVVMTHRRADGSEPVGTMVENHLERVVVRGSRGPSFLLGEPGRPRFTDGYLYACVSHARHPLDTHLQVGSAGGWRIMDFHGYGRATVETGAVIYGGFRTKIRGMHLQNFRSRGLAMLSTQESVFISELSLDSDNNAEGAVGLFLGRNAAYEPTVTVSGFSVTKDSGDHELDAIRIGQGLRLDMISRMVLQGRNNGRILRPNQ